MSHHLFNDTMHVILWKVPDAKCVVDGPDLDGVIREGSWEGPGDQPTEEELAAWIVEFTDQDISEDLHTDSLISDAAKAGMFAVFEATTGSPPTEEQKETLVASMRANLKDHE
jgi:hypothetical protein